MGKPREIKLRMFEGKDQARRHEQFKLHKETKLPLDGMAIAREIAKLIERVDPTSAVYASGSTGRGIETKEIHDIDLVIIAKCLHYEDLKNPPKGEGGQWKVFQNRKVGARAELLHIPEGGPKLDIRFLWLNPGEDEKKDIRALQKYGRDMPISMRNFVVGRELIGGSEETARRFEKYFIKTIQPNSLHLMEFKNIYSGDSKMIDVMFNPIKALIVKKLKKSKPKDFVKQNQLTLKLLSGRGLHSVFEMAYRGRGLDYLTRIKDDGKLFSSLSPATRKKIENAMKYARKKGYTTKED